MSEREATWLSPVQIIDSSLLSLNFSMGPGCSGEAGPLVFTLDVEFDDPDQRDDATICVGVVKFDGEVEGHGEDEGGSLFAVSCALGIAVEVDNRVLRESLESYTGQIKANALALAYGKIRSIIESVTAQSVVGKQTIPAINAQTYFGEVE